MSTLESASVTTIAMTHRYILFHKPYNVLSQFTDRNPADPGLGSDRGTLSDYLDIPGVYPVGRLDRDSEGLLLLTDHGWLQHRLSHPKFHHPRTYWAQVERIPEGAALAQLAQGVIIQNYRTRPAQAQVLTPEPQLPPRDPPIRYRKTVPTAWVELTLTEGKNRQVRRMTAAVGHPTLRLVRVAIADLTLGSLQPGEWRELSPAEAQALQRFAQQSGLASSQPLPPSGAPRSAPKSVQSSKSKPKKLNSSTSQRSPHSRLNKSSRAQRPNR